MKWRSMNDASTSRTIVVPSTDVERISTGCGHTAPQILESAVKAVPDVVRVTTSGNGVDLDGKHQILVIVFRRNGVDWPTLLPQVSAAIRRCWTPAPHAPTDDDSDLSRLAEENYPEGILGGFAPAPTQ